MWGPRRKGLWNVVLLIVKEEILVVYSGEDDLLGWGFYEQSILVSLMFINTSTLFVKTGRYKKVLACFPVFCVLRDV